MIESQNPVVRSTGMKGESLTILLNTIKQTVMDRQINTSTFDNLSQALKSALDQKFLVQDQDFKKQIRWNVIIGSKFSASATVGTKWFAHVYLKGTISLLAWAIE